MAVHTGNPAAQFASEQLADCSCELQVLILLQNIGRDAQNLFVCFKRSVVHVLNQIQKALMGILLLTMDMPPYNFG